MISKTSMTMTTMMMMMTTTRMTMTTTRLTMTTRVTQLWDLIEARGFCKVIKDINNNDDDDGNDDDDNDDHENNDEKKKKNNEVESISALALHRDLGFSQRYHANQIFCR